MKKKETRGAYRGPGTPKRQPVYRGRGEGEGEEEVVEPDLSQFLWLSAPLSPTSGDGHGRVRTEGPGQWEGLSMQVDACYQRVQP